MSVDLDKLAKQVDEALAKETKESLTNWLNERRQKAEASDSGLYLQRVSNPVCQICDTLYSFDDKNHIYTRQCDC